MTQPHYIDREAGTDHGLGSCAWQAVDAWIRAAESCDCAEFAVQNVSDLHRLRDDIANIKPLSAPMKAVGRAYCQKCGGKVEGWICQSCDQEFREDDAGNLVFDDDEPSPAMEAVAWRIRPKGALGDVMGFQIVTDKYTAQDFAEQPSFEVQALAVIPTEGAQTIAAEKMAHILQGMIARGTAIDNDAVDRALTLAMYQQDPTDDDRAWAAEASKVIPTEGGEQSSGNTGELNTEGKTNDRP